MGEYSVTCDCGRKIPVAVTKAGDVLSCTCGRDVLVPRMSELRKAAGESAIPLSTVERINKMVAEGALPVDDLCPLSLRPTDGTLIVRVTCEKAWFRAGSDGSDDGSALLLKLLFGVFGVLAAMMSNRRSPRPAEYFGRDTTVDLRLRIAEEARSRYSRQTRRQLMALLGKTPIYAKLFDEFPHAKLEVLKRTQA